MSSSRRSCNGPVTLSPRPIVRRMPSTAPPVLLLHGAATTARCWDAVALLLQRTGLSVTAPDRASTGDLEQELAALRPFAEGAFVVGVSGGATLGLAMAAEGTPLAGAVLHEPAVGSLLPGLLAPMAAAFADGGVPAFGARLYGPAWTPAMAPAGPGAVARDLAMFARFEPSPPAPGQGGVLVTVGGDSPPIRHAAAAALAEHRGYETAVLPGCRHLVQVEAPGALADLVLAQVAALSD